MLVLHDMLDLTRGKLPRFVRNFMGDASSIDAAIRLYVAEVKAGRFPDPKAHSY